MTSKPEDLEWIDIPDFSAGITSTRGSDITPAPDGSASTTDMCVPGPSGGLIPGPRLVTSYSVPAIANLAVERRDPNYPYAAVLDFLTFGFGTYSGNPNDGEAVASFGEGPLGSGDEFALLTQHYDLNGTSQRRVTRIAMQRLELDGSVTASIAGSGSPYVRTYTTPTTGLMTFKPSWRYYGPGNLCRVTGADSVDDRRTTYAMLACASVRSNNVATAPYINDYAQMWSWGGNSSGVPGWEVITNDGSGFVQPRWVKVEPSTPRESALAARRNPIMVTGHQGRGVCAAGTARGGTGIGGSIGNSTANHQTESASSVRFSADGYHHATLLWDGYFDVAEIVGGISAMASLSSDDLFLLGQSGGAVRVRGDLGTSPQISRQPSLPSGHGRATHIVPTENGLAWGTRNGAWLWSGGDTAESLSPQLAHDFWWRDDVFVNHSDAQVKGRPVATYPYLFFPNGWICDLRFRSWFRFGVPGSPADTTFLPTHYSLAANGDVFACQPVHTIDNVAAPLIRRYDPRRYHDQWSWTSQPFARSRNRVLGFREIAVTVQSEFINEFTITLSGVTADGTSAQWTKTLFVTNKSQPQVIRFEMALDVAEAQLTMSTTSAGDEALAVHRVSIGYNPERSVARR